MNKIYEKFSEYFEHWDINLPKDVIEKKEPGLIQSHGWHINYVFGTDEKGEFLDFYASHRMTNDRQMRIYSNGEIEWLDAPDLLIIYPDNATDDEKKEIDDKRDEYNTRVLIEISKKYKNL